MRSQEAQKADASQSLQETSAAALLHKSQDDEDKDEDDGLRMLVILFVVPFETLDTPGNRLVNEGILDPPG